ncbi:MAG: hypothetical protein JNJ57_07205 [Saprospiraceae bacterium]|nr:hypothetical protein [Saprospiraceae bacterium]
MKNWLITGCLCIAISLAISGQQVADSAFTLTIERPSYKFGTGPVVMIDEWHQNFHTAGGRYAPFARVLQADGFRILPSNAAFSEKALQSGKILVISNALHASNVGNWTLPTPSAFTKEEIKSVQDWIKNGGALFLIADHMPFAGAAQELAQSFGFKFLNCFANDNRSRAVERFYKGNGTLAANELTQGIDTLVTFTGSAFKAPKRAKPLLILKNYTLAMPITAWQFEENTPVKPSEGYLQGAYMHYGKGRIVVMGEAAMFSAQLSGPNRNRIGMNSAEARQNAPFLLNLIRWLDGQNPK